MSDCGSAKRTHVRVSEAAEMMGVHEETIRRMLNDGRLVGERVSDSPKSVWLISIASIEAFGRGVPTSDAADTQEDTEGE